MRTSGGKRSCNSWRLCYMKKRTGKAKKKAAPKKAASRLTTEGTITMLPIEAIRLDFQPPENLDPDTVQKFAEALRAGGKIPAVRVYSDGKSHWLADGFHRLEAARMIGLREIEAEVIQGTRADLEADWHEYLRALHNALRTSAPGSGSV